MSQLMDITVGHTPDSDDAFMFYGMHGDRIPNTGFTIRHAIEDIEKLNRRACRPDLDVTAISAHACAYAPDYTILRSGGSFGINYGPIVTARKRLSLEDVKRSKVAIPGKMTSAFLLLQLMIGKFEYVEMNFSDIPTAVREGVVDAGLVIHETQLSYDVEGNVKIADIGEWWNKTTGGLPVPLGINAMRTNHGEDLIRRFDAYLHDSILYGMQHFEDALDYAMRYSRGRPRDLIARFVKMYVNEKTVDMGTAGEESINLMMEMARKQGLVPNPKITIAPDL